MIKKLKSAIQKARTQKVADAVAFLTQLGFGPRQANTTAAYSLLACLDITPEKSWLDAASPSMGITPIIAFIKGNYGVIYAPNTRETIRDEAIGHFVETGLLIPNPDEPKRPTTSPKTVYKIEATALDLARSFGTLTWPVKLSDYRHSRHSILEELRRSRDLVQIPVRLPSGEIVKISPGGQNPLIKEVIEEFCPRFAADGVVVYIGDAENKSRNLQTEYIQKLGVIISAPEKIPDVIIHDTKRNWLLLIEAVSSAGPVDAKRRKELKELFHGCTAGLVFVTAFPTRAIMRRFLTQISWETEVWVAEDPSHMIHFNGEKFLGPYSDVVPPVPK